MSLGPPRATGWEAPSLGVTEAKVLVVGLAVTAVVAALVVRRTRARTPAWAALLLDLVPLVWMFLFAWSLVHLASDLIPALKRAPLFNGNALASAGLMAFVLSLVPRRARGPFAGAFGLILSVIAMCDMLHMRIFGGVMPFGSHGSILQLWDARTSVAALFERRDLWLAFHFAGAAAMLLLWRVAKIEGRRALRVVLYVVPAALLAGFVVPVRADVTWFLGSKYALEVLNREDRVWDSGILESHIREAALDAKLWLAHRDPTPAELAEVEAYTRDDHAAHDADGRPSFGSYKGKNVLVLQIEAFEEWLVGATVNGQEVTPFLNQLAARGTLYQNIFNVVASSSTADCEYLFLNSNHPLPDGAVAFRRADNHFVTFGTTLRDAGYATLSMHGYRRGMWNRAILHPKYGFTHSLFGEELGETPKIGWGLDDHVFFKKLVDAAKKEPSPWFVYAITLSSHHPYSDIPRSRRRLRLGPLEGSMVGNYMHSAAFTDDALAQLFADLEREGLLKDTVVMMYGDHEAHLKTSPRDRASLASLTNLPKWKTDLIGTGTPQGEPWAQNRIPLLVLFPGDSAARTAAVYGAQLDFAPTLLHYLGLPAPRSFLGHALLPEDTGGFVARWDGSAVSPPLLFDATHDDCRDLDGLSALPPARCSALAERAKKQLQMSWLITNNDLARWLDERSHSAPP